MSNLLLRTLSRLLATSLCLPWTLLSVQAQPEREIPPAFGPYTHLHGFAEAKSFTTKERLVGTYYFYWYCTETGEHITNPQNSSDGLTDHPPTLEDFCYKSVGWHKKQLSDMMDAGIDLLLAVFWGAPSERDPKAALYWSYAGLGPLVQARDELLREGKNPPRIGLFYDTSTLQFNGWHQHIDLTTDYGKRWFYATIRDFFSAIPPRHWAMLDGKPIVLLYASAFAKNHDQTFIDFAKAEFKSEFGGRDLYLAPQDSWQVKADNTCAWGGAFGFKNPGIAELGPGYNDSAVYGRKPLIAKRENGRFYEENWTRFLRRPSNLVMLETWSEFHEGTEICESREYGRQYIQLTRKYADLYKRAWNPPWPRGAFTQARKVTLGPDGPNSGLRLVTVQDSQPTLQTAGTQSVWTVTPFSGQTTYLYFQVDDSFKWARLMDAQVEVEYLDKAVGSLGVEFDGTDLHAPVQGAYTRTSTQRLTGDGQWKTARFALDGARFLNSENGGADFRLVAQAPELVVRRVSLQRR